MYKFLHSYFMFIHHVSIFASSFYICICIIFALFA
uniref:Uncharacterized protein n=1 Tax=Anguilla anguilla TaxID=7936 RepID=A0A0E9XD61_ANGAN